MKDIGSCKEECYVVFAVVANKGGVGKTTLSTNIAVILAEKNKVLIIDTDGQGNCSAAFGFNPGSHKTTIHDVLIGGVPAQKAVLKIGKKLFLLPANDQMDLFDFDVLTNREKFPEIFGVFKNAIEPLQSQYDYIIIDTPPSLGPIVGNVLVCAHKVIIPVTPDQFAYKGLRAVVEAVRKFQPMNKNLEIAGAVAMQVDKRTSLHNDMMQEIRKFGALNNVPVFETVIPRSIRFPSAFAYEGKPAIGAYKNNPIVGTYYDLVKELV